LYSEGSRFESTGTLTILRFLRDFPHTLHANLEILPQIRPLFLPINYLYHSVLCSLRHWQPDYTVSHAKRQQSLLPPPSESPKSHNGNTGSVSTTHRDPGSSVGIATRYGLDCRGSIPRQGQDFSLFHGVETGSGAHPASYPMGTGDLFPGGKAAEA
jgi:hypothetical protein